MNCYILRQHCFLRHVIQRKIEGKMEGVIRRGRRRK